MGRLENKIAIVTGAGGGIGRAIAQRYAAEGAAVMVSDLNETAAQDTLDLLRAGGARADHHRTDVSVPQDVRDMVAQTVAQLGLPTVLVNNAGTAAGDLLQLHELPVETWDRINAVNLRGPFLCCKYVLPHMMTAGHGAVVNIASMAALTMAPRAAYAASKGGLVALTRSVAFQYGGRNIRANAICPGSVETALTRQARADGIYGAPIVDGLIPRRADPREIADAAVYLASDEAGFVTSTVLTLDGGALRLRKEAILPG